METLKIRKQKTVYLTDIIIHSTVLCCTKICYDICSTTLICSKMYKTECKDALDKYSGMVSPNVRRFKTVLHAIW